MTREQKYIDASRTAIITGGNCGLGYQCAQEIAATSPGWHVVITGRDEEKSLRAVRTMIEATGNPHIEALPLDLASLASVRRFAADFSTRSGPPLRAIVCNAAISLPSDQTLTEDGFEQTFGVNHLGHFLLLQLLLKQISPPARIVLVSSAVHDPSHRSGMPPPRFSNAAELAHPPSEPGESASRAGQRAYSNAKLCNVLCAYELSRRLRSHNRGGGYESITVNVFDPGLMPNTALGRNYGAVQRFFMNSLFKMLRLVAADVHSAQESGRALATLIDDPSLGLTTGKYFAGLRETPSSTLSYDTEKAAALWEASEQMVKLQAQETIFR